MSAPASLLIALRDIAVKSETTSLFAPVCAAHSLFRVTLWMALYP